MNNLFQFFRDKFIRKSYDSILIQACRDGDPHAAQVALKNGANPNTPTNLGTYTYSAWDYETQYTGTVHVTPILLAATSALGKGEDRYCQVVQLLMDHPRTDLAQVVFGHKKEWLSEQHHQDGYPPSYEEDYHTSLAQVLNHHWERKVKRVSEASHLYPISHQMSLFLKKQLLRKEKDLNLREAFLYLVDGLVAHERSNQEKRLLAKASEQKIASL